MLRLPDKPNAARPTIQRMLDDTIEVKVRRATTTRAAKLQIKAKQMAALTPLNQSELKKKSLISLKKGRAKVGPSAILHVFRSPKHVSPERFHPDVGVNLY